MSQENVEIVRRAWDLWLEDPGNWGSAWDHRLAAADSTLHTPGEVVGTASYVGRDGWIDFLHMWTEDFAEWAIAPERFIDAGKDRVVVVVNQTATGKVSGVSVEARTAMLYALKNGQITDIHIYGRPEEALEAAGLSE